MFRTPFTSPPAGLNDRRHHLGKNRVAQSIKQAGEVAARGLPLVATRVDVGIVWHVADRRRRDPDNLVGTLKPYLDGIVAGGLLEDDSSKHVRRTWQEVRYSDGWGIEIIVEEA